MGTETCTRRRKPARASARHTAFWTETAASVKASRQEWAWGGVSEQKTQASGVEVW